MPKSCRGKFIAQKPHAFINIGWVVSGCNSEQSGWPTCNGEYCCPCIIEDIMKIDISTSTNFSKLLYPSQGPFHFFQQIQNQKRMGSTTLFASYTFPLRLRCGHKSSPLHSKKGINEFCCSCVQASEDNHGEKESGALKRRSAIVSGVSLLTAATLGFPRDGLAVLKQGLLAGRIPGLSEPDEQGWRTYRRPDEKSGGHGVGWSPIIPYSFSVPQDWEEVPVSIADLGGTEIDLRFANAQEGRLFVIVAPVLRFADYLGEDARIENIGPPDRVINAFGPEVIGENVEGKVLSMEVTEHEGRKYYHFELEPPHVLITATAAGNRLYLFNVTANGLQWKRHSKELKRISETFRIVLNTTRILAYQPLSNCSESHSSRIGNLKRFEPLKRVHEMGGLNYLAPVPIVV